MVPHHEQIVAKHLDVPVALLLARFVMITRFEGTLNVVPKTSCNSSRTA